jgi:hypothetical protein
VQVEPGRFGARPATVLDRELGAIVLGVRYTGGTQRDDDLAG